MSKFVHNITNLFYNFLQDRYSTFKPPFLNFLSCVLSSIDHFAYVSELIKTKHGDYKFIVLNLSKKKFKIGTFIST